MHSALEDIRLVVFDLDGTLIDTVPDLTVAIDAMLADYGAAPAGVDKVRDWIGNGTYTLVERALTAAGQAEIDTDEAHDHFLEHYRTAPCEHTRVYDGVVECLTGIRTMGLTQALVTNKPDALLTPILETLGIAHYFSLTLGADSLAEKKPHPAPLLHAAEHAHATPTQSLMVGDSCSDIEAGKAAGFRTLAVTYGYNHGVPIADSAPDHILETLANLV